MPKLTAYASIFRDWEALLGAIASTPGLKPATDSLKTELESMLAKTREMKVQQEDLQGKRQAVTESLQQLVNQGQEVARKLRAQIVASIGSRTELLKQFGIPTRKRKPKKNLEPLPVIETPKVVLSQLPEPASETEGKGDPA